jgi:hypothetical protein
MCERMSYDKVVLTIVADQNSLGDLVRDICAGLDPDMFREGYEDRELACPDDSGELCVLKWAPDGRTIEYGLSNTDNGSE